MQVFSDKWKEEIKERYGHKPRFDRPVIYSVATNDELCSEIEEMATHLPVEAQARLLPRLRKSKGFREAYNELVAGYILRKRLDYEIEYERPICGLTPDWHVHSKGDVPAFFVEGFTINPSKATSDDEVRWNNLLGRLREIPINVILYIRLKSRTCPPNTTESKEIAREVGKWLAATANQVGERLTTHGISFENVGRNRNKARVAYMGPASTSFVNTERLRQAIKVKAKKYQDLAALGTPLAVSIVPGFLSGYDLEDLQDLLWGSQSVSFSFDESAGEVVDLVPFRKDNGLMKTLRPAVSAVLWIVRKERDWSITAVYNPNAENPLPLRTFQTP